jgi:hypothetical protein
MRIRPRVKQRNRVVVCGVERFRPVSGTTLGERLGHSAVLSVSDLELVAQTDSAEKKIHKFIELAIRRAAGSCRPRPSKLGRDTSHIFHVAPSLKRALADRA